MKKILTLLLLTLAGLRIQAQDVDCQALLKTDADAIECAQQSVSWCKLKMQHAQIILHGLIGKSVDSYTEQDEIAVEKLEHFWGVKPPEYGIYLEWAISVMQAVRDMPEPSFEVVQAGQGRCTGGTKAYTGGPEMYSNPKIMICSRWGADNFRCRRHIIMHELLHLVGLKDWKPEYKEENNGWVHPVGWRIEDVDRFAGAVIALTHTSKTRAELQDLVCVWEVSAE